MSDDMRRDAVMVICWLTGLHVEKPADADEQWPLAVAAAYAFMQKYAPEAFSKLDS